MIHEARVLEIYEEIAALTGRMLAAARGAQWDALVALERNCSALFSRLVELDDGSAARGTEFQRRKAEIIRKLLDDDAQIRVLVEPWLAELPDLLSLTVRRHQLGKAYQLASSKNP